MDDRQVTAIGLTFVYFAMGTLSVLIARIERSAALRIWTYALFCFASDEAFASVGWWFPHSSAPQILSWIALVTGAGFSLAGIFRLLGRPFVRLPMWTIAGAVSVTVLGALFKIDRFYLSLWVFELIAALFFWSAALFLQIGDAPGVGHKLASFAFGLVGLYSGSWPFVSGIQGIRRFEFFLDLSVVLWSVAGVWLLHFERGRARIQELAQQQLELRARLEQSERLEALGRLAGGVAHDYNNVLTTVIHGSELVLRQIQDRPAAAEHLRVVLESARGAARFTRQLLALGRRRLPGRKPTRVDLAVSAALKMVRPSARKGVRLQVSLPTVATSVLSGDGQLEQIIVNLMLNALDAMPDGGRLELDVSFDPELNEVKLRVSDAGQGMSPETMAHIFEPFFTTKGDRSGTGTGLGLAAVYAIVQQMDGQIDVQSRLDEGSVFTVTLPATAAPAGERQAVSTAIVPVALRVLIVDDQEPVLRLVSTGLAEEGFRVMAVSSAAEALSRVECERPGLLITDLNMPDMTGLALLERLRRQFPDLPAIIMTARAHDFEPDAGRYDVQWLLKPFTPDELKRAIHAALGSAREPVAAEAYGHSSS